MHDHRTGKVVKFIARGRLDPGLHAKVLVPSDALKEGVHKTDNHSSGDQLGPELGPLGNAARNDGGNGRSKGQQEEKLDQVIAIFGRQLLGTDKEVRAVGHAVANHKINHGGDREVDQDLDQRIDLVLFANCSQLQKRKTGVHGQDHDAAQQYK